MSSEVTSSDRSRRQQRAAKSIGIVVRQHRKRLGVTQQALAQMAGCGLVFVYNIEHGKPSLRFDKLMDVLDVLGLELVVSAVGARSSGKSVSAGLRVVGTPR